MKSFCTFASLIVFSLAGYGQEVIKKYVQAQAVPVKSIDPATLDYSDLEVIGRAVGDARVVMLGEQDHGDGATFLAKTRLVKYLHEQKGFDVLAFEGDFFALNHGWEQVPKDEGSVRNFVNQNVYPVWTRCNECRELLHSYIPRTQQTDRPLQVAGFDSQMFGALSHVALQNFVRQYLAINAVPFGNSPTYEAFFLPFIDTLLRPQCFVPKSKYLITDASGKLNRFEKAMDSVLSQLSHKDNQSYELMILTNLKGLAREMGAKNAVAGNSLRDGRMAQNLEWLIRKKYPDKKVIVWAANAHISKGDPTAYRYQGMPIEWMGSVFTSDSLNNQQTYVLGFNSQSGTYRRAFAPKTSKALKPKPNGFETWMPEDYAYAFVDFKGFRTQTPAYGEYFQMKGIGHYSQPARWTNIFDGIFYIKEMTPCGDTQ